MGLAKIDAEISDVVDCGKHFSIACTFFGPEPSRLMIKKQNGLEIKSGDGISCYVKYDGKQFKLDKKAELYRGGAHYAQAKLSQ
jgi:hypothetical protein